MFDRILARRKLASPIHADRPAVRMLLRSAFTHYERAHLRLDGQPQQIRDESDSLIGHVDRVRLCDGTLHVVGWAYASRLRLVLAGMEAEVVPALHRPDVASAMGGPAAVGFELSLPCDLSVIKAAAAPGLITTPLVGKSQISPISLPVSIPFLAHWRIRLTFLRDLMRVIPEAARWWRTRDSTSRDRIKVKLRLNPQPLPKLLGRGLFLTGAEAHESLEQSLTIVLPVYNAFELLQDCLNRVEAHTDLPYRLILVEDASPDARIRPFLRNWARERKWVELIENSENIGFVGAVNRGLKRVLEAADEGPVVLLNSDALVPADWASRLCAPLAERSKVASVTPMSNDAEILTAPVICRRLQLAEGQAEAIDAAARRLNPEAVAVAAPTGVGFCMAIARDWLRQVGPFDTIFGRGYGEEVDWCQRARAKGGEHLALGNLFVEHRGGESFGQVQKNARITENGRIITRRWPDFDLSVQRFISIDPLRGARLAAGLAWAGSLDPSHAVPVYLAHSMGGGAELYLQNRIGTDLEQGHPSVVLRVGGKRRWRIELVTPLGVTHGESDDTDTIRQFLACLPRRRVIYSCAVGDPDPAALPAILLSLVGLDDEAELLFHDYFPLSPDYTLLGSDGVYRGPVQAPSADPAHATRRLDGREVSLHDWQKAWHSFATRAEVVTFSHDSAWHVSTVWPDLAGHIQVRPHRPHQAVPVLPPPAPNQPIVIGVLGNIGLQKGARVLRDLSQQLAANRDELGLVLIGNIDPTYMLASPAVVHGDYSLGDLPQLVRRYGITHWLIPSIWPETFCYTVHEALATSLPVMAFDIGAQGEAVRKAPNGIILPHGEDYDPAMCVLTAVDALISKPEIRSDSRMAPRMKQPSRAARAGC